MAECKEHLLSIKAQHIQVQGDDYSDFQHIRVRRHALWHDACKTLKRSNFDAGKPLKVTFVGEAAIDDGGPLREFFSEVQDAMFNSGSLFQGESHKRSVVHNVSALCNNEFKVAGNIIAMSLVQGGKSPSCLSPSLYAYMIGGIEAVNPSLEEICNRDIRDKAEMVKISLNKKIIWTGKNNFYKLIKTHCRMKIGF